MAKPNDSQLPALLPQAALVLRRTQTTLGLVRDVVQESSAMYWYLLGEEASIKEEWDQAIHYYYKCRKTAGDLMKIEALEGLSTALGGRSKYKADRGDFEGSDSDERASDNAHEAMNFWIDFYYAEQ